MITTEELVLIKKLPRFKYEHKLPLNSRRIKRNNTFLRKIHHKYRKHSLFWFKNVRYQNTLILSRRNRKKKLMLVKKYQGTTKKVPNFVWSSILERGVLKINNTCNLQRKKRSSPRNRITLRRKPTNRKWTRWLYLIRKVRNRRYRPSNPRKRKYKLRQRLNHGRRIFLRYERRSQVRGSKYQIRKSVKIDEVGLLKRSDFLTQLPKTKQLQQKLGLFQGNSAWVSKTTTRGIGISFSFQLHSVKRNTPFIPSKGSKFSLKLASKFRYISNYQKKAFTLLATNNKKRLLIKEYPRGTRGLSMWPSKKAKTVVAIKSVPVRKFSSMIENKKPFNKVNRGYRNATKVSRKGKRRKVYFKWKYRFPKWRFYNRNLWKSRSRTGLGPWFFREVYSFRMYRRPHQPYRNRNILFTKNKAMFRQISTTRRAGALTKRNTRLVSRRAHFKLFSEFYGPFTAKQLRKRASSLRRSSVRHHPKRRALLAWFEQRLDVGLCRFRLAPSIRIARHLITQGYVVVNKIQIISPEYKLAVWDLVEIIPSYRIGLLLYWRHRNWFQRFLFKNKGLRFKATHQQNGVLTFGFWTRLSNPLDIPRRDKIDLTEVERLSLW